MHKKQLHEAPDTSTGYEQSDLDIGSIVKGVTIFFGFAVFVAVVVMGFFLFKGQYGPPPVGSVEPLKAPKDPNPILQNNVTGRTDIWNLRAKEDDLLTTAGWVDESKGIARVPIEDAIKMDAAFGPEGNRTTPFATPPVNPPAAVLGTPIPGNGSGFPPSTGRTLQPDGNPRPATTGVTNR